MKMCSVPRLAKLSCILQASSYLSLGHNSIDGFT